MSKSFPIINVGAIGKANGCPTVELETIRLYFAFTPLQRKAIDWQNDTTESFEYCRRIQMLWEEQIGHLPHVTAVETWTYDNPGGMVIEFEPGEFNPENLATLFQSVADYFSRLCDVYNNRYNK